MRQIEVYRVQSFNPSFLVDERIELAKKYLSDLIPLQIESIGIGNVDFCQGSVILLEDASVVALVLDNSKSEVKDCPHIVHLVYGSDGNISFESYESSTIFESINREVEVVSRYAILDGLDFVQDFQLLRRFSFENDPDYIATQLGNVQFLLKQYRNQEPVPANQIHARLYLDREGSIAETQEGAVAEFEMTLQPQIPIGLYPFNLQKFRLLGSDEFLYRGFEQDLQTVCVLANYLQPALTVRDLRQLSLFEPASLFTLSISALFQLSSNTQLDERKRSFEQLRLKQYQFDYPLEVGNLKFDRLVIETERPPSSAQIELSLDLILSAASAQSEYIQLALQEFSITDENSLRRLVSDVLQLVGDPAFDTPLDQIRLEVQIKDYGLSINCRF